MASGTLSTVERAFQILDLLWKLDGAGPTEIAERMDVPDSTVYDYLRSLCETEFVTRQKGSYRLTHHFLTIGGKMRYRNRLFQVAKGEMKRLATETDELVGTLSTYAEERSNDSELAFESTRLDSETAALTIGTDAFVENTTVSATDGNVTVEAGA